MRIHYNGKLFRPPLLRRYSAIVLELFYMIYIMGYLKNLRRYRDHDLAYANIAFEKEAYAREDEELEERIWRLFQTEACPNMACLVKSKIK